MSNARVPVLNTPEDRVHIVVNNRDCFVPEVAWKRGMQLHTECLETGLSAHLCPILVQTDADAAKALEQVVNAGATSVVAYLGTFGREGAISWLLKEAATRHKLPVAMMGAAEPTADNLINDRGDALCGLLSASYNCRLRNIRPFVPNQPIGSPADLAKQVGHFVNVARVYNGLRNVKLVGFGPRPENFNTCHAPLQGFYDLGIEVTENSELDLLRLVKNVTDDDPDVALTVAEMKDELNNGNIDLALLTRMARLEVALTRYAQANLGTAKYVVFAIKCWPAFPETFGHVICYVNSRLAARGLPVACEVDFWGAASEYALQLATGMPATLLDINNSVPADLPGTEGHNSNNLFMGFHCGNTPSCHMKSCGIQHQLIMKRLMEPEGEPNFTRGTLEGQLAPSPVTIFRLQGHAPGGIGAYIAEGNILDVNPRSFGGIGVFSIPDFQRFYRWGMLANAFPHHAGIGFSNAGRVLFDAMDLLGVDNIIHPLPYGVLYPGENPFRA